MSGVVLRIHKENQPALIEHVPEKPPMSTDDEKQSLDDAIERLEAERQRRIDEKIERGEAVRVMLDPVVGSYRLPQLYH